MMWRPDEWGGTYYQWTDQGGVIESGPDHHTHSAPYENGADHILLSLKPLHRRCLSLIREYRNIQDTLEAQALIRQLEQVLKLDIEVDER